MQLGVNGEQRPAIFVLAYVEFDQVIGEGEAIQFSIVEYDVDKRAPVRYVCRPSIGPTTNLAEGDPVSWGDGGEDAVT